MHIRETLSAWNAAVRRAFSGTRGKVVLGLAILVVFAVISWSIRAAVAPTRRAEQSIDLQAYGLPGVELRLVDDFPRTASGKIRKVDLRAWLRAEHEQAEHQQEGTS